MQYSCLLKCKYNVPPIVIWLGPKIPLLTRAGGLRSLGTSSRRLPVGMSPLTACIDNGFGVTSCPATLKKTKRATLNVLMGEKYEKLTHQCRIRRCVLHFISTEPFLRSPWMQLWTRQLWVSSPCFSPRGLFNLAHIVFVKLAGQLVPPNALSTQAVSFQQTMTLTMSVKNAVCLCEWKEVFLNPVRLKLVKLCKYKYCIRIIPSNFTLY